MKTRKLLLKFEMFKYYKVVNIGIPINGKLVPVSLEFPLKLSK